MRALFEFPRGCPPWPELRARLQERFARIDFRSVPADGACYEAWSAHPLGSRLYYSFGLRRDGRLAIDGSDLWELDRVLEMSEGHQVPPADVARLGPDGYRFVAMASWEPEGCELFVDDDAAKSFQIERGLLVNAALAPVTAVLLSVLPQFSDEDADASAVAPVPVPLDELLVALSGVKKSSLAPLDRFVLAEVLACRAALSGWLERRIEANEPVSARLFVSECAE